MCLLEETHLKCHGFNPNPSTSFVYSRGTTSVGSRPSKAYKHLLTFHCNPCSGVLLLSVIHRPNVTYRQRLGTEDRQPGYSRKLQTTLLPSSKV